VVLVQPVKGVEVNNKAPEEFSVIALITGSVASTEPPAMTEMPLAVRSTDCVRPVMELPRLMITSPATSVDTLTLSPAT